MAGFNYPKNYVKYIDVFRQRYFHYENIANILNRLFDYDFKGRSLLDLGCGTGTFAIMMADQGYRVTGIDASEESIEIARERAAGRCDVEFHVQDFRNPALDEKFDLITQLHVPISVQDIRDTIAKYRLNLKEDGYIAHIYLRKSANVISDDKMDADRYADPDGKFKIVRFNQWLLDDLVLRFISIVFIEEDGKVRLEFDKAKMQLLPPGEPLTHEFYSEVGDIPTHNRDSTPPWTTEFLQVLRAAKKPHAERAGSR